MAVFVRLKTEVTGAAVEPRNGEHGIVDGARAVSSGSGSERSELREGGGGFVVLNGPH